MNPQSLTVLKDNFERRRKAMEFERDSFLPHWQEIADYISPRTVRINKSADSKDKGNKVNQKIMDNTATLAWRTFKSGIMAGLTSPARPWFRLTPSDPSLRDSQAVKQWTALVEDRMREVFNKSNFYMIMPIMYGNLGLYGTTSMAALEDDHHLIRFYPFQIGTFLLALSDTMHCDSMYRVFPMTASQLAAKFGIVNCSETVQTQLKTKQTETEFDVVHVVEPNVDRDPVMSDARNKPFRSVYYESNQTYDRFLRMSGFDEFPVMAPRWDVYNQTDVYGYSPAMDALGDIKQLQIEQKRKMQALDKWVNPPMIGDSSLRTARCSTLPGELTYIDGLATQQHAGLRPLYTVNPDVRFVGEDIKEVQQRIKRAFFEDMMQMLAQSDNPEMTAREIEERHSEKVLILGPVMERLNDELFDPVIDRTFNIMLRRGAIPRPPRELEGQALSVEYVSILAQAAKLMGIANDDRLAQAVGGMAGMNPSAIDKLDIDAWIDDYADKLGTNPRIVRTADQVKALRDARAKQQQMQALAAMAQPAERAAKAGKALGETDPENVQKIVGMMMGTQ